jgi:hypothetical protein
MKPGKTLLLALSLIASAFALPPAAATPICLPGLGAASGLGIACVDCPQVVTPVLPVPVQCKPPPPPCRQGYGIEDSLLCPRPVPKGASCVAHGLLVLERDGSVPLGDVTIDHSQSKAWDSPAQGLWFPSPQPMPRPPSTIPVGAHADAQLHGFTYDNAALGLSVGTSTVNSRCDVQSLNDVQRGFVINDAYGRGSAQDVRLGIGLLGLTLRAAVLDYQEEAFSITPGGAFAAAACDVYSLDLNGFPPELQWCPLPNTAIGPLGVAGVGTVTLVLNEEWGPVLNGAGQWAWGGAALHVQVALATGATVDVYVGYAAVAVAAGGPAGPAFWANPHPSPWPTE